MEEIFPPPATFIREHGISPVKTLKTFLPHHPVEKKIASEQDF
jgi:hypothetical protein